MNLFDIFIRSPINRQTYLVTSQKNTVEVEASLSRDQLVYLVSILKKKHVRLKKILQITSDAQHHNLMYRINKGTLTASRFIENPRISLECKRLGIQINRLNTELAAIRKHRKMVWQFVQESSK